MENYEDRLEERQKTIKGLGISIFARGEMTTNTSQSIESSFTSKCKIFGSIVHSSTDHESITKFKKSIKPKPTKKWVNKKNKLNLI